MLLIVNIKIFSLFPLIVYCLTFFVSKFQGFLSNRLPVTKIPSSQGIHGCNWKNHLFHDIFFQTAFISKWFEQQKFNLSKMKDNFMLLMVTCQSVSDLVRLSTCPFVGSSVHCLSSHHMNIFGIGKTLLPQWVINPLCYCSCSLALIWDWEWVWGWCVDA